MWLCHVTTPSTLPCSQGIARQRSAIVNGLRDSVKEFSATVSDVRPRDVLELMLMTQVGARHASMHPCAAAASMCLPRRSLIAFI